MADDKKPQIPEYKKSFEEILADGEKRRKEAKETPETPKEEKKEEPKQPDIEKVAKETVKEEFIKRAEEEQKKLEAERKEREEETKRAEEKKKREEMLKPKWQTDPNAPKDKDGKPLPKSYDEIVEETERITREKVIAEIEERERQREIAREKSQKEQEQTKTQQAEAEKQRAKQFNDYTEGLISELMTQGKLPRIVKEGDENDEGEKAKRELYATAVKVNNERLAKGQPIISNIKEIFYEHYKSPTQQPAGGDAPVMTNSAPPASTNTEDRYIWARDHKKTTRQILAELNAKVQRKTT